MTDIIVSKIADKVRDQLSSAEAGHDWLHIERVWHNALEILKDEAAADTLIVQLAALLHDIADAKFNNGDETVGPRLAKKMMSEIDIDEKVQDEVILIIENISYKGGFKHSDYHSIELDIVRDADRLDAIGAIGVARAFTYGGFKNRRLYDVNVAPVDFRSKEDYKTNNGPTINHFYEKLLKLKDLMQTHTGKQMAQERHRFMLLFLENFMKETGITSLLKRN